MINISICIPSYNQGHCIGESIESAMAQKYPHKEILVIDDLSKDNTVSVVKKYPVRLIENHENIGIGMNLVKLMEKAYAKYILYLCGDDVFVNDMVASDVVNIFDQNPSIGVIGRYYYQFIDGHKGAVMVIRDRNILTSSCNPSGMALRKSKYRASNKIFVEMPSIVAQALQRWRWTMMEYDTIAARVKPGSNTATKPWYYTESPLKNWIPLVGNTYCDCNFMSLIQLKNRAPQILWPEIKEYVRVNPSVLWNLKFILFSIISLALPGSILRPLSNFYRHRISRMFCRIIKRPYDE